MSNLQAGFYWDDGLQFSEETSALTELVWPHFLIAESDMPDDELSFEISEQELARRCPVWGIREVSSDRLVAFITAVQLYMDPAQEVLPNDGWNFAARAVGLSEKPNCLCLLAANVHPEFRGNGFATLLIERAKSEALKQGFTRLIAPVRPTLKHEFAGISMEDYVAKTTETGEIFDPWIKLHVKSGGRVANICWESVRVQASLRKWREWTGLPLLDSGKYQIDEGLVPLEVSVPRNVATYTEPNVWVRYELSN